MSTEHIIELLILERDRIVNAIDALGGATKKRGRPRVAGAPDWVQPAKKQRKKRVFTAAQRKQQAERMKKYWADKRKAAKPAKAKGKSKAKPKAKAVAAGSSEPQS